MSIYFPMTAEIITPGHIRCLQYLAGLDMVIVGLLSNKALKGYKKCVVSLEDRQFVLTAISKGIGNILIVHQHSLDPTENIRVLGCDSIASGDGWEIEEDIAIAELGLKKIDIPFPKTHSSSKIKSLILENRGVV